MGAQSSQTNQLEGKFTMPIALRKVRAKRRTALMKRGRERKLVRRREVIFLFDGEKFDKCRRGVLVMVQATPLRNAPESCPVLLRIKTQELGGWEIFNQNLRLVHFEKILSVH